MAEAFWVAAAVVTYVYVGYPLLLVAWARVRPRPVTRRLQDGDALPGVSIVIAARNEAANLGPRIENLLSLDYPHHLRQIIVVSDGSTDGTPDLLAGYRGVVDAVDVPRGGKALALNAGVAKARFDVIVFTDARQTFATNALRELVAPFGDLSIGGVTGELLLDAESALFGNRRASIDRRRAGRGTSDRRRATNSTIGDGVGVYWRYEKQLRRLESSVGSTLGATGAIYAIRRSLWQPLPADTVLDDVLTPMRVVLRGYRVVFNDRAQAYDRAARDSRAESRRKVRTLAGNFQILRLEPRLLAPWANAVWLQYVSHKLGRLMVPYALLVVFAASIALAGRHVIYQIALAAQVTFYLLAGYGAVLELAAQRRGAAPSAAPQAAREAA